MGLPAVAGVGYVVACQSAPAALPQSLVREDIEVYFSPDRGLSRNRNFAFSKTSAPFALIADDDLVLSAEGLKTVIDVFENHPKVDIATFRCAFPFEKTYPEKETPLSERVKNYYITSYEIAVRMESLKRSGLKFNELMGIGSNLFGAGEEHVFIQNAMARGLNCRFFPFTIVNHPGVPTGRRQGAIPAVLRSDGVIIAMSYGFTAIPRILLKAWRRGGNFFSNLYHISSGAIYFRRHPNFFN